MIKEQERRIEEKEDDQHEELEEERKIHNVLMKYEI